MIVVINTRDLYVIAHFPRLRMARYVCSFRKDFFADKSGSYNHMLPALPDNGRSVFYLNDQQDTDVAGIMQKINEEKGSGYIFSDDLQRTYIMELIHYITKLHYQVRPSAN
jgi:hypothetical protein